jgi:SNF2 family DNA or RNA helicase
MDVLVPKLQTKNLRRAPDAAAYQLYRAAQEWDLVDPILIQDRQDLKSEHKWRDHIEPYRHQVQNLITFCRRLPVTLLADDVGLGKTISAGLVASELMARNRISKFLVVCPKLLMPQWKEELESKFGIPGVCATGKELLQAELPEGGGAVITTYQSARMYLNALGQAGFEMLVLDEAHKLRNLYGANQAPQVAQQFREVLANRMFKYVLMLTATPIHNRLWDIYSLVDLLAVASRTKMTSPFNVTRSFCTGSNTMLANSLWSILASILTLSVMVPIKINGIRPKDASAALKAASNFS